GADACRQVDEPQLLRSVGIERRVEAVGDDARSGYLSRRICEEPELGESPRQPVHYRRVVDGNRCGGRRALARMRGDAAGKGQDPGPDQDRRPFHLSRASSSTLAPQPSVEIGCPGRPTSSGPGCAPVMPLPRSVRLSDQPLRSQWTLSGVYSAPPSVRPSHMTGGSAPPNAAVNCSAPSSCGS